MRYEDMLRQVQDHFRELLKEFRERVEARGPPQDYDLDVIRASRGLADDLVEANVALGTADGSDALLAAFCERRGITGELAPEVRERLLLELQNGHKAFVDKVLEFNSSFDD